MAVLLDTSGDELRQYADGLARRRENIYARIDKACNKAGRSRDEVKVLAVSKTVSVNEVLAAIEVGYRYFGENRPQELAHKLDALSHVDGLPPVRFDMIGNLQTNKINSVLGRAELVHSISSYHLAQAVSERAERRGMVQDVLLEVNVSGEASKSGFSPDEVRVVLGDLLDLHGICIKGLMTMAPRGDVSRAHKTFAGLRELRDEFIAKVPELELSELSCGMSEDFEAAIEEGSTLVRLGRVVFSPDFELR